MGRHPLSRPPAPPPAAPKKIHLLLIALLACAAYANVLRHPLFLDDDDNIVKNAYVRDWRYLPRAFSENSIAGAGKQSDYYRPAIQVLFTAGYALWKLDPIGYHAFSLAFHALAAGLLYVLLAELLGQTWTPLLTALLFTLHPAQTEALNMASGAGIPLGMICGLLALLAYLRAERSPLPRPGMRALSLLAAAASLLCKETMVVVPGYVFLLETAFLSREESSGRRFWKGFLKALPYLAVAGIYIGLRFTVLDFGGTGNLYRAANVFTASWRVRFYTFCTVMLQFLPIIFWPRALFMERSAVTPVYAGFAYAPVMAGFALLAGLAGLGGWAWLRAARAPDRDATAWPRIASFGILWFLFGLVPVSNVVIPISTTIVESWLYLPMAGLLLIVAHAFVRGMERLSLGRPAQAVVWSALLLVCLVRTVNQNRVWRDPVTFYEHTLRHAPGSARFRNNLAMAYEESGHYADAVAQYREAIRRDDEYPETHHNLGIAYAALGKSREAEAEFERAIAMNPKFHPAYLQLASLYAGQGRTGPARQVLENLVARAPERWEGYYNLGRIYQFLGDPGRATAVWRRGLAADPYNRLLQDALKPKPAAR